MHLMLLLLVPNVLARTCSSGPFLLQSEPLEFGSAGHYFFYAGGWAGPRLVQLNLVDADLSILGANRRVSHSPLHDTLEIWDPAGGRSPAFLRYRNELWESVPSPTRIARRPRVREWTATWELPASRHSECGTKRSPQLDIALTVRGETRNAVAFVSADGCGETGVQLHRRSGDEYVVNVPAPALCVDATPAPSTFELQVVDGLGRRSKPVTIPVPPPPPWPPEEPTAPPSPDLPADPEPEQ